MQQDVLGLEVSVDVAEEVEVLESHKDLCCIELDVSLLEPLLGLRVEETVELAAITELHHKVEVCIGLWRWRCG